MVLQHLDKSLSYDTSSAQNPYGNFAHMEVLGILQHGPERSGRRSICGNGAVWEEIRIGIGSAMPATATVTARRLNSFAEKSGIAV
jgi:hypothetical protein